MGWEGVDRRGRECQREWPDMIHSIHPKQQHDKVIAACKRQPPHQRVVQVALR